MSTYLNDEIYNNMGANQKEKVQHIYKRTSLWLQNLAPHFFKDEIHLVSY